MGVNLRQISQPQSMMKNRMILIDDFFFQQCSFVTVACESVRISNSSLQELVKIVTDNGYQEGSRIRHVTSTCSANANRGERSDFKFSKLFSLGRRNIGNQRG